ncbi:MAG: outer membrane beta-barrel protein [Verrucomicrobiia bacterium]
MKFNKWTVALAAIGVVSLASAARADEQPTHVNMVATALSSTTLSGYVDTAATWRLNTDQGVNGGPNLPPYAFSKNDGFSLNAVDLALDHPEDQSPWAAGYHVELMAGPDSVPGVASTSGTNSVSSTPGGVSIRQAYVTLRMPVGNGIDWKVGVWDTIIGYESSSDPLNPNYTRSYGYTIEPTTHTGVLATYKINDMLTVQAGVADGSNVGTSPAAINGTSAIESQKAYMGDIQFTAPDSAGWMKGATFTLGAIDAAGNTITPGHTSLYAGATLPTPDSALKLGAAFDYLDEHDTGIAQGAGRNASDNSIWVIGLYGNYQATDKLSFNLRGEYVDGDGLYPTSAGISTTAKSGAGEEFTATVQYNLWANVISRVEFRWDHAEQGKYFGYNPANGNATRNNDFLLALNLIYQF